MNNLRRADWAEIKEDVMLKALRGKFRQHPELAKLLLSTVEKRIVESTSNDRFWGESLDGIGQNMLGELLMLVRTELE